MTLASFVETRLEIGKDYGAVGGSEFNTTVIEMGSGREKRNSNHANNLGRWDLGSRNLIKADIEYLHGFFRARRGKAQGFRYKDWLNFDVIDQDAKPAGYSTIQLVKDFTDGGVTETQVISKPVATGFSMLRNGGAFSGYSLDDTTGVITLTEDVSFSISGITKAANGVVTSVGHTYSDGDEIFMTAINGMTELNGVVAIISGVSGDTFNLNIDTTNYSSYTSGGFAKKFVQSSETLTWTGEFDTPARFDTDTFKAEFIHYRDSDKEAVFNLQSLPVVGLKL